MSRTIRVKGPARASGDIRMPGDKSISHRLAMLASVAQGASTIKGFASSADCWATIDCIRGLNVRVDHTEGRVTVHGRGLYGYSRPAPDSMLDAGNSGSTIRMLSGLLAGQPFTTVIDGDQSLRRRPMGRILEPLSLMGASIEAREGKFAPLRIGGGHLTAINYKSRVASAQVKTCVLLAGLYAAGQTTFSEPARSRDHTEVMLGEFGARLTARADGPATVLSIEGGAELRGVEYEVPGDLSSAAFFVAAGTLLPDSHLTIRGVSLNPTRAAFIDLLGDLGASVSKENTRLSHGEAVGDLRVRTGRLSTKGRGTVVSGEMIPNIIDEIPILAIVGTQVEGRLEVRDARELRVKESDRIRTVVDGVRSLGGRIEEFEDGFGVEGPQRLVGGRVETAGDHRIAMAFTIAGLIAQETTEIVDAESASVSFPEFYDLLSKVTDEGRLEWKVE